MSDSVWLRLRSFLGGIGWRVFLWSVDMKDTEYWDAIYRQEWQAREDGLR